MATIPIEVIVQDGSSPEPTPTPSDSGETNIVVPDTGAGVVSSGSTFASSSVASIVLPAILLIVALFTICTLLIRKRHKRQDNDKFSKKEKLITATSTTIAVLAATVLVGNLVIPATKAATSVEPGTAELDTVDKITITATREIDSDITVATVKNTSYATANLDFGYKVTASMIEGATTANLYLNGDETSEYYIAPVSGGALADNTWGYTLTGPTEESSYLSIPLSTKPTTMVKEIAKTAEDKPVDIYYTVQIDKDMPNGTYTGELEYTLSPAIEYMQDFSTLTPAEKTATLTYMPEGKQYILKDIRDKKPYYISKLADGNVWMTQNLDLDLISDPTAEGYVALTPDNTNITANWIPKNSTLTIQGTSVSGWSDSDTEPYSADPGMLFIYSSGSTSNDEQYTTLSECQQYHSDCNMHNHAGNYYNWSAAVASNDTTSITEQYTNVETSICPAGWRLPKNRNSGSTVEGNEQITQITSYDDILGEYQPWGGYNYQEGGFNKIRTAPLWLARSGYISYGSLYYIGRDGYYWSSTVYGSDGAYTQYFSSGSVYRALYGNRGDGYSVRCVAQ